MPSNTSTVLQPLSDSRRQTVLNDLLDSLIAHPKQSIDLRASETKRIARKRRVGVMQVAGVRAALTSGSYGSVPTLLRQRRRSAASAS